MIDYLIQVRMIYDYKWFTYISCFASVFYNKHTKLSESSKNSFFVCFVKNTITPGVSSIHISKLSVYGYFSHHKLDY